MATRNPPFQAMTPTSWHARRRTLMRRDPVLAPIIRKYGACALKTREGDIFCGLVEAIVSQQLSTARPRRFMAASARSCRTVGRRPKRSCLCRMSASRAGLSRQKLAYMRDLSRKMLDGSINTQALSSMSDDEIVAELTKIKGIGRWTVEMLLIFRLTRPDVFPVGDLGIVKAMRKTYNLRGTRTSNGCTRLPSDGVRTAPWRPGTCGQLENKK
jgi:DNA-3-methyladenine glycosylase II